jgi:hypothetical protein
MHQTLSFTKRRATNKLFLIILNNMTILILDIKVAENVDLNKVMKQTSMSIIVVIHQGSNESLKYVNIRCKTHI